jgi:hypothetical protein
MGRAVDSILDPWPATIGPIWDFFASECAYCGIQLVKTERLGHIDHATAGEGNHLGNLVLACSICNGDEKLDTGWRKFLELKVGDLAVRQGRMDRIERWQQLHPKPERAASPEIAAVDAELREMIVAFGEKCAQLRNAVANVKNGIVAGDG